MTGDHHRSQRQTRIDTFSSQAALLDPRALEGARHPRAPAEREEPSRARVHLSADEYFQDHGLSHSEDFCASRLSGPVAGRTLSTGGTPQEGAVSFWQ